MQKKRITALFTLGLLIAVASFTPAIALGIAEDRPRQNPQANNSSEMMTQAVDQTMVANDKKTTAQTRVAERKLAANENKLTGKNKLKCEKRQATIKKKMLNISERGQRQMNVFDSIAIKTQEFYLTKGATLTNYEALEAEVTAKKAAAQFLVDSLKETSIAFTCDGSDPKGQAASFKTSLVAERKALKDYKTAVKNLIVGVKSVQATTEESQ